MDIEKAKKVNNLAKELQQGFDLTNDEAFKQARAVFNEPPMLHPQQPHVPVATDEDAAANPAVQGALDDNRYFSEINTLRNDVANLSAEVVNMRGEIERLKIQTPTQSVPTPDPEPLPDPEPAPEPDAPEPAPDTPEPVPEPMPEPAQPETPEPTEKEEKDHPRSGGYRPEDVAIEKMFYFGNK
ncbi:MAG: hypothetical protein QF486_04400 [Candidatus Woesearchaeota archaeon]|nr:hypothetical protein [Candidatus Woesearchaeota archaeon]MDP7181741.1 hypothetical protein [Candidatus Woesearchaeota archaeon]MDP7198830.1 hypothetical protein [Candidatus Woesearchaeota archaeon]MDP7467170.1 hypothetical protein [Candidatus Woesearchaeota archaeon]MDP7647495.1 hypothetical protein [Candidatus Woesearchaeota archaeon]